MKKSTVQEIKARFDHDVERFANLETGQLSTVDAKISLELLTEAAKRLVPNAENVLDIGCGAGNYTLMLLQKLENLHCTLLDLSKPMLDRALARVSQCTDANVSVVQDDIRVAKLAKSHYDIILAGAVLHHLRDDEDWHNTFSKLYRLLKPGGCLMISDLITQDSKVLNDYTWERYGDYLESLNGKAYRHKVLAYIDKEDSPRSLNYQLQLMQRVGFKQVDILHKNICFATFVGIK